VLELDGIDDRERAEDLRGRYLRVPGDQLAELEEGEYYVFQLVGLIAVTEEDRELGVIREVLETGANDVYVVDTPRGELLLPAIEDVVKQVDLAGGKLIVHLLSGLMPEETDHID
jgi:16S rRNA processing protein RimM